MKNYIKLYSINTGMTHFRMDSVSSKWEKTRVLLLTIKKQLIFLIKAYKSSSLKGIKILNMWLRYTKHWQILVGELRTFKSSTVHWYAHFRWSNNYIKISRYVQLKFWVNFQLIWSKEMRSKRRFSISFR